MPEGHVLHRAARLQGKRLAGRTVRAESPQGRFSAGAAEIDGTTLDTIEARGKHLFYRFENERVVHVHLGLFGKFRLQTPPFPDPSPNARLLLSTDTDRIHLAGPTTCALLDPEEVDRVIARLGPDPILDPADGAERLAGALARRRIPIGTALLDQKVLAGIGNVYRSELLFLVGLHPFVPANEVDPGVLDQLWKLSVDELRAGERSGRIVTVRPADVGETTRSALGRRERLYAYKRQGKACRRCAADIVAADIDGRNVWWCPRCQPEP
ncbi:MAG: DNA-formamidopyrimidine glycosylase family protein [Actinomycetota bacterium]